MSRRLLLPAAVIAALAPAASASAATLQTDRPCYIGGQPMQLAGSGFAPAAPLTVGGTGTTTLSGNADASGAFGATLEAPSASALGVSGVGTAKLRLAATDTSTGAQALADVDVAAYAFGTNSGVRSPSARRTWRFSGFLLSSKPIYGHFRFKGRTRANYRFGAPQGPCGTLTKSAPGIPVRRPGAGKWIVQIDQSKSYSPKTTPKLSASTTVFLVPR